ncbi:MAG: aspartate ammonia-lyase [DPANN group archaeon]|nr:aspartate ammonia-lyase [DPANN group archaeon]
MRTEKDSLGTKDLPDDALYSIHTQRSLENFGIGEEPFPLPIVHAMARLKQACARANAASGDMDEEKARAIEEAAKEVSSGRWDRSFRIDTYQAGSGTSSHMNVNEVIANLAAEKLGGRRGEKKLVHPNDDVNRGQSSNNIVPSAIRMAAYESSFNLLEQLQSLILEFRKKGAAFKGIIKAARTHLQDAVPITLGQEFDAYARMLEKDLGRVEEARKRLLELGVGGNAVGTGLNTKEGFRQRIIEELKALTKLPYQIAVDGVEMTQSLTDLAAFSAMLKMLALDLQKVCNDLRLLSSGPHAGFHEIILPPVEPGSSIMPGKVNPSICESVIMACMQVQGLDHAIVLAAGAGQLELNTHMPLVGRNILKTIGLLTKASQSLGKKCITGIKADEERCRKHLETSAGLATILNPLLGYDKVAELVKQEQEQGKTLRELVLENGIMDEQQFEELIRKATGPGLRNPD